MRPVFYVSDGTGITTETIGHSMLAQFQGVEYHAHRIPFVDNTEKAQQTADIIELQQAIAGQRAIVFTSVVDMQAHTILAKTGALMLDVLTPFAPSVGTGVGRRSASLGSVARMPWSITRLTKTESMPLIFP